MLMVLSALSLTFFPYRLAQSPTKRSSCLQLAALGPRRSYKLSASSAE